MVQLTRSFALLFCVVSLAVDSPTVGALPLPNQRSFIARVKQTVKESSHGFRRNAPEQLFNALPAVTALRGSTLASRQAAEAKRMMTAASTAGRTENGDGRETPELLPSTYCAEPKRSPLGWIVTDSPRNAVKAINDPDALLTLSIDAGSAAKVLAASAQDVDGDSNLGSNGINPTSITNSPIGSPHHTFNLAPKHEVPEGASSLEYDIEDSDDKQPLSVMSQGADVPAHPLESLSDSSQSGPTIESSAENSNNRRSLDQEQSENRYSRQVTRTGEQHPPAAGAEPEQGERAVQAGADVGVENTDDGQARRRSLVINGHGINILLQGGNEDETELDTRLVGSEEHERRNSIKNDDNAKHDYQHLHRRLAIAPTISPIVGQLGILQPLEGALGSNGMSQLVGNLVLAPLVQSMSVGSTLFHSLPTKADGSVMLLTETPPMNDTKVASAVEGAFLLAPSVSADGIRLQMVDKDAVKGEMNDSNWKHVEFQATLTNAQNEPHLYCAVVRTPSSLQMDLCDGEDSTGKTKEDIDGASRMFLFDSSTGEVLPYLPRGDKTAMNSKRETIEAAKRATESGKPQAVKLVFFTDQTLAACASCGDESDPPLLSDPRTATAAQEATNV